MMMMSYSITMAYLQFLLLTLSLSIAQLNIQDIFYMPQGKKPDPFDDITQNKNIYTREPKIVWWIIYYII